MEPKSFELKMIFGSHIFLDPKFFYYIFSTQNICWLDPKSFVCRSFLDLIFFWFKFFSWLKFVWTRLFLVPKFILDAKKIYSIGPKIFLD